MTMPTVPMEPRTRRNERDEKRVAGQAIGESRWPFYLESTKLGEMPWEFL
jgi:hypothetical protein